MKRFYIIITLIIVIFIPLISFSGEPEEIRISYDANGNAQYIGIADSGTDDGESRWSIEKFVYDSSGNFIASCYAKNNPNKSFEWDERANYAYGCD